MAPETLLWIVFGVLVAVMMVLDLAVFHRKAREVKTREALVWSGIWIGIALLYNLLIYFVLGHDHALLFLTAFITEKSLGIDNMFVFLVIFSYFGVPVIYQHKVLFWGIIGALIMRGIFIVAGLAIIERFHYAIYAFGAFLIFTGIRLSTGREFKFNPEVNPLLRLLRRFVPFIIEYREEKFFVREGGRRVATLLFFVLLVIETTDILFAVDSVPAVLAISLDPFIVYTSNVFAVMGLRALFFAIAGAMRRLKYLSYGLAAVMVFLGVKMLTSDIFHFPPALALGIIGGILAIAAIASLLRPGREEKK